MARETSMWPDLSGPQSFVRTLLDARAERQRPMPPSPPGLPVLGSLVELQRDVLGMIERGRQELGDTIHYRLGPFGFTVFHAPETIRRILLERNEDFGRSPTYGGLRLVLGNGLLTSEGEFWQRQRKLMAPAFHYKRLREFGDTMVRCASELADEWDAHARRSLDAPLDLHEHMLSLTFHIVGLTLFSTELGQHAGPMGPALEVLVEHANYVATTLLLAPPPWLPTPRNRRFVEAKQIVDEVVYDIIARRRRTGEDPGDLLGMLMAATGEDSGETMSDTELRDEVATLVLAGHETTAQALTWTFMLLSQHPAVEARVVEEIERVCGDRLPTIDDLEALAYTGWVIDEALRLYPPAWLFERQTRADIELEGYAFPAGAIVAIAPWSLHRHPRYWPNPEGFDPERFSPERSAERPRYTYLPFGGGPRQCIGVNFALYEAKLVLATLIQRYSLELVPSQNLRPRAEVTLRPSEGMKMWLRPR